MITEGGTLLFPLSEHAIMGVSGVLRALPFIIRGLARYLRMLRDDPPDLVVLVDYPGLHLIMGRLARKRGIPVLHYIAPQYWAWAPWRMNRYRHCVDATLTILPFESAFYERAGLPAKYVGHPLLDELETEPSEPSEPPDSVPAAPMLCMLLGSRRSEITTNAGPFVAMARRLRADFPDLRFVAPHTSDRRAALIRDLLGAEGAQDLIEVVVGPPHSPAPGGASRPREIGHRITGVLSARRPRRSSSTSARGCSRSGPTRGSSPCRGSPFPT